MLLRQELDPRGQLVSLDAHRSPRDWWRRRQWGGIGELGVGDHTGPAVTGPPQPRGTRPPQVLGRLTAGRAELVDVAFSDIRPSTGFNAPRPRQLHSAGRLDGKIITERFTRMGTYARDVGICQFCLEPVDLDAPYGPEVPVDRSHRPRRAPYAGELPPVLQHVVRRQNPTVNDEGPRARRRGHKTARLEAFSDGVFSIAITLLVLELGVASSAEDDLLGALAHQWPSYLAYLVSFSTIGAA